MKFYDVAKNGYSDSITCQPTSNTECAIECDTTENPLTFYIQNLTNAEYQSTEVEGEKYITMNIDTSNDDGLLHSSIKGSNTFPSLIFEVSIKLFDKFLYNFLYI